MDVVSEEKRACYSCGKSLRIVGGSPVRWVLAAHKCPHKFKCSDSAMVIPCPSCSAVLDVKPAILAPPCVWCAPVDDADGVSGKGCARCSWRGRLPTDGPLLAELRAGTAPIAMGKTVRL